MSTPANCGTWGRSSPGAREDRRQGRQDVASGVRQTRHVRWKAAGDGLHRPQGDGGVRRHGFSARAGPERSGVACSSGGRSPSAQPSRGYRRPISCRPLPGEGKQKLGPDCKNTLRSAPPAPTLRKPSDIVCTLFRCSSGSFPSRSIHPDSWPAAPGLYQQIRERLTGAACPRFPESRSSRRPSVASHSPALIGAFISGADRHWNRR